MPVKDLLNTLQTSYKFRKNKIALQQSLLYRVQNDNSLCSSFLSHQRISLGLALRKLVKLAHICCCSSIIYIYYTIKLFESSITAKTMAFFLSTLFISILCQVKGIKSFELGPRAESGPPNYKIINFFLQNFTPVMTHL